MTAPLTATMRRARKDPVARLLAAATAAGVRFRIAGATLEVDGADGLHQDDRALLRRHLPDIRARLEPPEPEVGLLELLGVEEVEVITTAERAREVIGALGPGAIGLDVETAGAAGSGVARPWIAVTKAGRRAVNRGRITDRSGLDPLRARPRLVQLYPGGDTVYVIDLAAVPIEVLAPLEHVSLIAHNAAFEAAVLGAHGVRLRRLHCTLMLARLALGAERGGLKLADVAAAFLGVELPKAEQVSDWGAARLSEAQITYAAADAVVARRLARPIWDGLDAEARRAYKIGNATVPVVAAMRLAGIPFDRAIHAATIARWERDYAAARARFTEITGEELPPAGARRSAWLEQRMCEDLLSWWPRTDTGLLRTRAADLDRLAVVPEIRPLLDVATWDKRLRSFGRALLGQVGPDGRLHADLMPAATKTGRCAARDPNVQQMPQDVRAAVVAPAGRALVIADYRQAEFRVAAELSGDDALRRVFRDGEDIHRLTAGACMGAELDALSEDEQEVARSKAKRIGFGTLYGSSARGLAASVWSMYRVEMSELEAAQWQRQFYLRYPRLRQWQNETADRARATGVLRSVTGRPLRAEWEGGQLRWTLCCNFPVQSSAADAMMLAMARVHAALEGLDARLLLQVHDELVVEAAEADAPEVARLLVEHMTAAWLELFPDAPHHDLVDVATRPCWAKPPKE